MKFCPLRCGTAGTAIPGPITASTPSSLKYSKYCPLNLSRWSVGIDMDYG